MQGTLCRYQKIVIPYGFTGKMMDPSNFQQMCGKVTSLDLSHSDYIQTIKGRKKNHISFEKSGTALEIISMIETKVKLRP
ncbi:hypothetical protein RclHR1_01760017 [Rhizophagus clarus]|uniref:Uncharacterized protein n=1 Tax=Rhizophagus clarus TaxID=94130 RepID=A0A2Z6QKC4_9GLOM|nr:hypothetical protein RclHR1_01760017 [Rhizophagus clarus]